MIDNHIVERATMSHTALLEALERFDNNQSAFSRNVGCSQQIVSYWLRKKCAVAPEYVLKVESATGVSRHVLRPDLYPRDPAPAARAS